MLILDGDFSKENVVPDPDDLDPNGAVDYHADTADGVPGAAPGGAGALGDTQGDNVSNLG